jgi:cellulose synthase/poly-beta-1,6-N-acetylglucosamine synthase-like glycosyltransferase
MTNRRFWEIVPGASAWITLLVLIFLSWQEPAAVVIFILLFDLYWLLKLIYLYIHLRYSFVLMRKKDKEDWLMKLKHAYSGRWENIEHIVILPVYQESYEIVRGALQSLIDANYPSERFFVILALEESEREKNEKIMEQARKEFGSRFGKFFPVFHPSGLSGEIPGKGSNDTWAIRKAKEEIIDPEGIPYDQLLVSTFDVDTRPGKEYFGVLVHAFLSDPDGAHSSFQPIPIFTNNVYHVSPFARLIGFSSTFWQLMQQARPEQLVTFSSHSMPFRGLVDSGYWDTDIVSEDSRIFFQALMQHGGRWKVTPLFYPVYMDAVEGKGFWDAIQNLYKQQRRWAWGIENFPYMMSHFSKQKEIPSAVKRFWILRTFDGFYSWSTSSFVIFLFGWLPNLLGGDVFHTTLFSYNLPRITGILLNLSTLGIVTAAFLALALLPIRPERTRWRYLLYFLQWALMPATFIILGSIPALESQTRLMLGGKFRLGFWSTPKQET